MRKIRAEEIPKLRFFNIYQARRKMMILGAVIIVVFLFWIALCFNFWYRSFKFEKFFGFETFFFDIKPVQREKVEKTIRKKLRELMARPWEPNKNNPMESLGVFLETKTILKEYCQMVAAAEFFGYGFEDNQISVFEKKIKNLNRTLISCFRTGDEGLIKKIIRLNPKAPYKI